jgi:cytoplasmic iron level regulating protein YaaA (DUF328/UPF0246 family)
MSISEKLSALNFERFQTFKTPLTLANAKQALFAQDIGKYSTLILTSNTAFQTLNICLLGYNLAIFFDYDTTMKEPLLHLPKAHGQTRQMKQSQTLIDILKDKTQDEISSLMSISEKLSALNFERFQTFKTPLTLANAKQHRSD